MPLLAAPQWFEIAAALLFFLITGIAQFLQKRAEERRRRAAFDQPPLAQASPAAGPEAGAAPPRMERAPPTVKEDWEAQLRRLLEGEPEPAPAPPPVLRRPSQEPGPLEPDWEESRSMEDEPEAVSAPPRVDPALEEAQRRTAAQLAVASASYQRAASLAARAGDRMKAARSLRSSQFASRTRRIVRAVGSPPMAAMFRQPAEARKAVIAATVLAPPKALE